MKELIERLEKADGPNFALEQEIMWAVRGVLERHRSPHDKPPAYTASIDAALSTISGDLYWMIAKGRTRPDEPLYGVQLLSTDGKIIAEAEHEILPIALCIAALRAIDAMSPVGKGEA